jgi:hypothetical protein
MRRWAVPLLGSRLPACSERPVQCQEVAEVERSGSDRSAECSVATVRGSVFRLQDVKLRIPRSMPDTYTRETLLAVASLCWRSSLFRPNPASADWS